MYKETTPEREKEIIEKAAKFLVRLGVSEPAILFLQGFKALAYVGGSYAMMFVEPFVPFYESETHELINVFSKTENFVKLSDRIDELVNIQKQKEREERALSGKKSYTDKISDYLKGIFKRK